MDDDAHYPRKRMQSEIPNLVGNHLAALFRSLGKSGACSISARVASAIVVPCDDHCCVVGLYSIGHVLLAKSIMNSSHLMSVGLVELIANISRLSTALVSVSLCEVSTTYTTYSGFSKR